MAVTRTAATGSVATGPELPGLSLRRSSGSMRDVTFRKCGARANHVNFHVAGSEISNGKSTDCGRLQQPYASPRKLSRPHLKHLMKPQKV